MWQEYTYPTEKHELYKILCEQLSALLTDEASWLPDMANAAALLFGAMREINWAGFYLFGGEELLLGPFQGKPACVHIPTGRGVCGTAALERKTVLVPDVHLFPGHIACDAASRSEIVIPLMKDSRLIGVLDIDSPIPGRFDTEDADGLERFCRILTDGIQSPVF